MQFYLTLLPQTFCLHVYLKFLPHTLASDFYLIISLHILHFTFLIDTFTLDCSIFYVTFISLYLTQLSYIFTRRFYLSPLPQTFFLFTCLPQNFIPHFRLILTQLYLRHLPHMFTSDCSIPFITHCYLTQLSYTFTDTFTSCFYPSILPCSFFPHNFSSHFYLTYFLQTLHSDFTSPFNFTFPPHRFQIRKSS